MHIIYTQTLDSIKNEDNTRKILRKQVQLEMDQIKMKEEATRKIEESQRKAEEERSKLYFIILLIGFLLLVVVAFFIYRNSRKQRLANVLLEKQKHQIEEQSNEIKDSINYARHIQQAILPEQSLFDRILPNSFVLYIPKDVVSGDFYFAKQDYDESVFVAAADCTGHGVPGAFMSLISSQKLEQAIKDAVTPGRILENLNREIINTLKQNASDSTSRDGLDIALINVSPSYNEDFIVKYAGANRPLIIIGNDGSINEVKADKVSIGGFTDINYSFTEHELELKAGETIYIYTDGFSDQFGGEKGKKLTSRKFRELLAEMSKLPIREQEAALRKFYLNWTKNNPQIDDVLVIGIKA